MSEIVLSGVSKTFPGGVKAVDGISLTISSGELMVLVGPSGCGKTTLLRMIAGLETVNDGSIRLGDRDITNLEARDRDIAMVFQNYALYPHMNVRDNLSYGLRVRKTPKREMKRRVDEVAELLGLNDVLDRLPMALSGGQRQRVAPRGLVVQGTDVAAGRGTLLAGSNTSMRAAQTRSAIWSRTPAPNRLGRRTPTRAPRHGPDRRSGNRASRVHTGR